MPISKEKADLKERFRDNPKAIAICLTESLATNELEPVLKALNQILVGQNVMAIAREAGINRATLYDSFGGKVDPALFRARASWRIERQARRKADTSGTSTEAWPPGKAEHTGRPRVG